SSRGRSLARSSSEPAPCPAAPTAAGRPATDRGFTMNDLPQRVLIQEEGPREGFQIEPGPIAVADKVRFIEALAGTGVTKIDCVSFVNPARVPSMADAEEVAASITKR